MKTCIKCNKEINKKVTTCPYCGEKQDVDYLNDLDNALNDEIYTKIILTNEQEKFKLFDYERVSDDTYIIKGLKNKYVYKVDIPEGVVTICKQAFANSRIIEAKFPSTLMEIESEAFLNCINLRKIVNFNVVGLIGDKAFYNCKNFDVVFKEEDFLLGNEVFGKTLYEVNKNEAEKKKKQEEEKKKLEEKRAEEKKKQEEENKKYLEEQKIKIDKLRYRQTKFDKEKFISSKMFGRYPQSLVSGKISGELQKINEINEFGYIEYDGNEYKECNGKYYLVEPIEWENIEVINGTFILVSRKILDYKKFHLDEADRFINRYIYPNNYEYSDIRAWLNGYDGTNYYANNYSNKGFINFAFNVEEKEFIKTIEVDNSIETTELCGDDIDNPCIICNNTKDKIYLLSCNDVDDKTYSTRIRSCECSDYARREMSYNSYNYALRSPSFSKLRWIYKVFYYELKYFVSDSRTDFVGVRPALQIHLM